MNITLKCGDCLKLLKKVPSNSIDLVVTDPPYSFNSETHWRALKGNHHLHFYHQLTKISNGFNPLILKELVRVLKHIDIYIFCNTRELYPLMTYFIGKLHCHYDLLTWDKTNPAPLCNNKYLNDTEYILHAREPGAHIYGNYHTKHRYYVTPCNTKDKKRWHHPTIKPLKIIKNLVFNSSRSGDTVLDPFMGSGTTGVACEFLNRKFIGYEIVPKYFRIAKKRISSATEQETLNLD